MALSSLHTAIEFVPQAQLWIGTHDTIMHEISMYAQTLFCIHAGCTVCSICLLIGQNNYYALVTIQPDKQYKIEQIQMLLHSMSLQLDTNEKKLLIIHNADFLTPACANKLLKPLEEPPAGYHFILTAQRKDMVLETVQSRCIIRYFDIKSTTIEYTVLYDWFCTYFASISIAYVIFEKNNIPNERETIDVIDNLIQYWLSEYTTQLLNNNAKKAQYAQQTLITLQKAQQYPPIAGNSLLFWKNLALNVAV